MVGEVIIDILHAFIAAHCQLTGYSIWFKFSADGEELNWFIKTRWLSQQVTMIKVKLGQ